MNYKLVGTIELGDITDVTDPCYDADVWCREKVWTFPGTYKCYVVEDERTGRIRRSTIVLDSVELSSFREADWDAIGEIGVDAGLAGYFNNKPDFDDDEWLSLCQDVFGTDEYFMVPTRNGTGFATSTGWGDGSYPVDGVCDDKGQYAAIRITFM